MPSLHSEKYQAIFLTMLRDGREASGLTQLELAEALGVDRTVVTKVETGVRRLDQIETFEWVRHLGIPFAQFAADLEQRLLSLEVRNSAGRGRPKS